MLSLFIISLGTITLIAMASGQPGRKSTSPDPKAMELMKPGPENQQITKRSGTWGAVCRFWMNPDDQLIETTGTLVLRTILDGRFLEGEFHSTIKNQPFTGRSVSGYNRVSKRFLYTWYDSMGTGIICLQGHSGADGMTVTYSGDMDCPINGHVRLRQVETCQSEDHFTHVMFQTKDGKETKTMEVTYTRRK